jgi:hypothetical protein
MLEERLKITVVFELPDGARHSFDDEATMLPGSLRCLTYVDIGLKSAAGKVYFERLRERFPHVLAINPFKIPRHQLRRGYEGDARDLLAKTLKQIEVPKTRYRLLKHNWLSDRPLRSGGLTLMLADPEKLAALKLILPAGLVTDYVATSDAA